ncbi:thiolase domain-containing protein [Oceanobacillus rekensis]|uniref:thiolase domain-containing protein n=1 Tax=Oceanobacillus rekensis TaxID=937927 RepID=UPI001FE55E4A|nr:thiolase domain-containing protein [Oceanobacillus rekensis]
MKFDQNHGGFTNMSIEGKAYIAGAFEHPKRLVEDKSVAAIHAECAKGALEDAGLTLQDVDGYFCAGDAPGGALSMVDYLGLNVRHVDSTETGGSSYIAHVSHAAQAITAGKCNVALITMGGRPRAEGKSGVKPKKFTPNVPEVPFEIPYGPTAVNEYAMAASLHMHKYGTTSEQLAWVKVAASHHAQYNPNARLKDLVTVEDVLHSPMIADPLHLMDCCVVSDGGGALVVVNQEIARGLKRPLIKVIGAGESPKGPMGGNMDMTYTAAVHSGKAAFEEAGVNPAEIKYAGIYDSFTITVIMQLEDLGFCKKGEGGKFVADGNLIAGIGNLPINTDGGGLNNNHPTSRGGMTKLIEAVRQLREEAHPEVQVKDCDIALVNGIGGGLGSRHCSATLIMERV